MRMCRPPGRVVALLRLAAVMMPQAGDRDRMTRVIAATGASGALGRRVAHRLAAAPDVRLRLVVRDAGGGPRVPGAETEDRLQQHLTAVGAAAAAGVRRIVSRRTTLPPTPRTLGAGP